MENKNNPFKIPENYFDQLDKKIISSVKENKREEKERIVFNRDFYKYAASVLLILAVGFSLLYYNISEDETLDKKVAKIVSTQKEELVLEEDKDIEKDTKTESLVEREEIAASSHLDINKKKSIELEIEDDYILNELEIEYLQQYIQGDIHDLITYNDIDL